MLPSGAIPDFDEQFRRRVISSAGLAFGSLILIAVAFRHSLAPLKPVAGIAAVTLALILMSVPVLIRRGRSTAFCGILIIVDLSVFGFLGGISNGGMRAPAVVLFVITPIIGFFCVGVRGARIALGSSILGMLGLLVAEHFSYIRPVNFPDRYLMYKSVTYLFTAAAAYAIGAAYERSRRISEERLAELTLKSFQAAKLSSLGEMAAGIAHEINTPLTIISGLTTLVSRQLDAGSADPKTLRDELAKINATTGRIARIVKGLRTFSRSDEREPTKPAGVHEIIESTRELCGEFFKSLAIELRVDCPATVAILGRPVQISQVLLNLLNNAQDAVRGLEERWVEITVRAEAPWVRISVTDSGKGIAPDVAERMMQPFFTTKEVGTGTGLGLSISLGIAQDHGGRLSYDPASPHTRFVLELPIAPGTG